MRLLEADMKMEQVLQSFMVDLEVDRKNASVAGQALDMCIKLVAPEYAHTSWNRYKQFSSSLSKGMYLVCCLPTNTAGLSVSPGQQQS